MFSISRLAKRSLTFCVKADGTHPFLRSIFQTAYKDADPRIQTINSVIIDGNGQTPKSPAFNEAFNAAGSPWQLLVQNAVWGSGDLKADNKAVTDVLSAQ